MHIRRMGVALGMLLALLASLVPTHRAQAQNGDLCFAETNQCISGRFRQYWEQNGGLAVFGYPISPATEQLNRDTGKTYLTQWFERNRFELHTENVAPYDVLLGRLGDDRLRQQGVDWFAEPKGTQTAECLWFAETGHSVCDQAPGLGFKSYWQKHGLQDAKLDAYGRSLALFGLPLTEPRMETNASGDTVLTQHFERARFEWHPNQPDNFKVLLGLLGNEVTAVPAPPAPQPPAPQPEPPAPEPQPPAPQPPAPQPPAADCADVPAPVNATVRPALCVTEGTEIQFDIFGFQPNEEVQLTFTEPGGFSITFDETLNIGPLGAVAGVPLDTTDLDPGIWKIGFKGVSSGHESVIAFKVLPR
jgi:biotin carboxyl carrier protein